MICPLLFIINDEEDSGCLKEKCAWWFGKKDAYGSMCVICKMAINKN